MKKSVAPRIAALCVLYAAVFTALTALQFSTHRSITRHIGALSVIVSYNTTGGDAPPEFPAEKGTYSLSPAAPRPRGSGGSPAYSGVMLRFGGMEFGLSGADGFVLLSDSGAGESSSPEMMVIEENSAAFYFTGSPQDRTQVVFSVLSNASGPELRISGSFAPGFAGVEIPFHLLRSARLRDGGDNGFVIAAEGTNFSFGRAARLDMARQVLILESGNTVSYRARQDGRVFDPAHYILAQAQSSESWAVWLSRWRDQVFAGWGRTPTAALNDEELLLAYAAEAVHRENYRDVISRIPRTFLDGNRRTYRSSVFLGGMNLALRTFTAGELERNARIQTMLRQDPASYFREPHIFAEQYRRGIPQTEASVLLESAFSGDAQSADTGDIVPALLEHWTDFQELAAASGSENPFAFWLPAVLEKISANLVMDGKGQWVLVFDGGGESGNRAGIEYNLRLGLALDRYGRAAGESGWAALGRSLALSALAFTDAAGTAPGFVNSQGSAAVPGSAPEQVSAARLYSWLDTENYPRLEYRQGPGADTEVSIWTAADDVTTSWNGDDFDISVAFPSGQTHYMLIRRVRPFTKVQFNGQDYRTDPNFERYDSSGWIYNQAEQTLLLKIRHRSPTEMIRINYTALSSPSPPPSPPPPPPPAAAPPPENRAVEESAAFFPVTQ